MGYYGGYYVMEGIKVGNSNAQWEWEYWVSVFFSLSEYLCVLERFGGVRQCWEQERTTCSGGWVNANNCGSTQMLIIV